MFSNTRLTGDLETLTSESPLAPGLALHPGAEPATILDAACLSPFSVDSDVPGPNSMELHL